MKLPRIPPRRMGLVTRLVALVVVTSLIAGGLVGLVAARRSYDVLRTTILTDYLATADLAAELVSHYMDGSRRTIRLMAEEPSIVRAVVDGVPEQAAPRLEVALQQDPHLDDLGIVDTSGILTVNGRR